MNNQTRILCKDCEYYRKNIDEIDAASCHHPEALSRQDPVNGFDEYDSCRSMRSHYNICGNSAKLFKRIGTL